VLTSRAAKIKKRAKQDLTGPNIPTFQRANVPTFLRALLLSACALFLLSPPVSSASSVFYSLTGSFTYDLNAFYNVFDLNQAGTIGVSLTSDVGDRIQSGLLISFDPATGAQLDSMQMGFGPIEVRLVETDQGSRVVVLTTEGDGGAVTILDMDSAGKLSPRAARRLSTNLVDFRSNMVFSPSQRIGFEIVLDSASRPELVAFSLDDASVISLTPAFGPGLVTQTLAIKEAHGRRLLGYINAVFNQWHLIVMDATDVSHPVEVSDVVLPSSPASSGNGFPAIFFSSDLRYAFTSSTGDTVSVIKIKNQSAIRHFFIGFYDWMAYVETDSNIYLAVIGPPPAGQYQAFSVTLLDASAPKKTHIIGQATISYDIDPLASLQFSRSGDRLYVASEAGLTVYEVPSLSVLSQTPLRDKHEGRIHTLRTWGNPSSVLAAWGVFSAVYGFFQ